MNPPPSHPEPARTDGIQPDVVQLFVRDRPELERDFPAAFQVMKAGGIFWANDAGGARLDDR